MGLGPPRSAVALVHGVDSRAFCHPLPRPCVAVSCVLPILTMYILCPFSIKRSDAFGLQHPEGVHAPFGAASARRNADIREDADGENHYARRGGLISFHFISCHDPESSEPYEDRDEDNVYRKFLRGGSAWSGSHLVGHVRECTSRGQGPICSIECHQLSPRCTPNKLGKMYRPRTPSTT